MLRPTTEVLPLLIAGSTFLFLLLGRGLRATPRARAFRWSGLVATGSYCLLLSLTAWAGIQQLAALNAYDLNGNGLIDGGEITPEYQQQLRLTIADTGRNLAFIVAGLFALVLAGLTYLLVRIRQKFFALNFKFKSTYL